MGNINTLARDGGNANLYVYTGNHLNHVEWITNSYFYDANGNATTDGRKSILLEYNHLNLPVRATKTGEVNLTYNYDATGQKTRKVDAITGTTTDYVDGIQYTNGAIDFISTEEGKAVRNGTSYVYEYNLTDHLGNVRYVFNRHPTTGLIQELQKSDYYPFGKRLGNGGTNKYLYNGKEFQDGLEQYDYGARFYDAEIGRWNVIDRFAEKYAGLSMYQYAANNPIINIDVNGDSTWTTNRQVRKGNNITIYATTHITGKVLKASSGYGTASDLASKLNNRLNGQTSQTSEENPQGGTTITIYNMDAKYQAANSMSDVSKSDHLVVMVDDVLGGSDSNLGDGKNAGGIAPIYGKIAYVQGDANAVETAFHEVGHNLGLWHPNSNSNSDPMSYTGRGSNFSSSQMKTIYDVNRLGNGNRGYNGARILNVNEGYNSQSTNERPYLGKRTQGMRIPLPVKNEP